MTVYKAPGIPLVFKYKSRKAPASDRLRTGQKAHHLIFGATLNKWLEAWASEMQSWDLLRNNLT